MHNTIIPLAGRRSISHVSKSPVHFHSAKNPRYRAPITAAARNHRLYHSYEHDTPPPFPSAETAILSAALKHVPEHGFTQAALTAGARSAGYLDISSNLFPHGPVAIINYHLVTQRLALAQKFPPPPPHQPSSTSSSSSIESNLDPIPSKIHTITLSRLHANTPIITHWQSALALLAYPTPTNTTFPPLLISELARLSDEILFLSGSTTVTSAWYTDRVALAAIYASAELFMTTDRSEGFRDTEGFLRRRLRDAGGVRRNLGFLGRWVGGQIGGVVDGVRSMGGRI